VLGVDRLDYTKGLVHRLKVFEKLLERHPEHIEKVRCMHTWTHFIILIMCCTPSLVHAMGHKTPAGLASYYLRYKSRHYSGLTLNCKSHLLTLILMISLAFEIIESVLWVSMPQNLILCRCLNWQRLGSSILTIYGATRQIIIMRIKRLCFR
jgi:hypothetical protein